MSEQFEFKPMNIDEFIQSPDYLKNIVQIRALENGFKNINNFIFKINHYYAQVEFHNWKYGKDYSRHIYFDVEKALTILKKPLPTPSEQVDDLIRCLAESPTAYDQIYVHHYNYGFLIGSFTDTIFVQVIQYLLNHNLITALIDEVMGGPRFTIRDLMLTVQGWDYYHQLQKGEINGNKAFMAMAFDNEKLDVFLEKHLKPAVKQTGFELLKVSDNPQAGLIDNRIQVDIQNSAFVIVDLSDQNRGAYMEAGYALGLGKPVIFICDSENWNKRHFDVAHHETIKWDNDNPQEACENIKAAIRNSLPVGKAIMQDKRQDDE